MTPILYAALGLLAALAPLALAEWAPPFVGISYSQRSLPFELLGLSGGALWLFAAWRAWPRARTGVAPLLEAAAPLLVALHFLVLTSEYAEHRFDYDCYEYAGRALLAGQNPYKVGLIYLYPPLTAKAMAAAFEATNAVSTSLGWSAARDDVWDRVFYLYQCAQLALAIGAYLLLRRFARAVNLDAVWAPVLVGALLVFDNPLFRTLRHGQVNLWILDLSLASVLAAKRIPALSGAALALAGHVKLYPLLLALPMAIRRRWRALAWSAGFLALIALALADWGRDLTLWREFADFARRDFPGEIALRNTSPHAIAWNATRFLTGAPRAVGALAKIAAAGFAAWYAARAWRRERALREATLRGAGEGVEARAFATHAADALAFSLLVSPSVWEHHYVLALPLALVAAALRGSERPGLVALGLFLVFGMPTFDLFPLSLHRLAGMWMLLALTPARRVDASRSREEAQRVD
ncbi:MAG TPA: glycosyltransferase family 87 protein [Myxococcota bacterium]|nr:glycosyltransferase family 87 protein [Myxococcota bacterium]